MRMQRSAPFFLALLATAVILLGSSCGFAPTAQEEPTPTPIPISAVPSKPLYIVQRGDVTLQAQFTGRVVPIASKALAFQKEGRVKEVYVQIGDMVKAGQVLAALDSLDTYEEQKTTDLLNLRRAEVLLEIAKLKLEQAKLLLPSYPEHPDYLYAQAEVAVQEYQVELAEIALEEVSRKSHNIDEEIVAAQIIAPFDGKVLSIRSGLQGSSVTAFETVMAVGDVSSYEIAADLDTGKLASLSQGMQVIALPENHPGTEIHGEIRLLPYPFGSGGDEQDGDSSVRIHLDEDLLRAGFSIGDRLQIIVIIDQKEDVLWLPPQAIRTFEGRTFVILQGGEIQRRVDIKPGIQGNDRVEILEGLSEDQAVISP